MANEQEKNVTFAQPIESNACLYDIISFSYTRQDVKEKRGMTFPKKRTPDSSK